MATIVKQKNKDFGTAVISDWREELMDNITTLSELKEYLPISPDEAEDISRVCSIHPMNIPRYYLSLIDPDDPDDPIRKMAVPSSAELAVSGKSGETTSDPYGDDKHNRGNGILHKYPYSVLVVVTEYCSMYCRHCFRKRMVGLSTDQTVRNFLKAVEYVREHEEITNVILSGGDPLLLPTESLEKMLKPLMEIDHVNFVRIGSRAPVVFPMRFFDDDLLRLFTEFNRKKALFLPTHFNHANEITSLAAEAVSRIRSTGTTVNNQTVFLRGVNDSPVALEDLMNGLVRIGVNPYYLYQCMPVDRVREQFQIPLKEGIDTVDRAKSRLDGYAKRFKFIMGHESGKIEICGRKNDVLVLSRIHSRPEEEGGETIILRKLNETGGWLEDFKPLAEDEEK